MRVSMFPLLASHAGRGARMLEVYARERNDEDSVHPLRLQYANYAFLSRQMLCRVTFPAPLYPRFEYQSTVENTYGWLPRPPQAPAAPFKRIA